MIRPPFGKRAKSVMPCSISFASCTPTGVSSTPSEVRLVGGLPHGDGTLPCIGRRGRGSEKRPQPGHTCVADRLSLFRLSSLSCQSFGPQPFQIFAQRFLLLLVFGQGPMRW